MYVPLSVQQEPLSHSAESDMKIGTLFLLSQSDLCLEYVESIVHR